MNPESYPTVYRPEDAVNGVNPDWRNVQYNNPRYGVPGGFIDQRFYLKCEDTDEISEAWTSDPRRFVNLGKVWALMRAIRGTVPGISITVNSVPGINGDGVGFLRDHNREEIHIIDDTGASLGLLEIPQVGALLKAKPVTEQADEVLKQE